MEVRLNTQTTQNPPSGPENPKADNSREVEKSSLRTGVRAISACPCPWQLVPGSPVNHSEMGLDPAQLQPLLL